MWIRIHAKHKKFNHEPAFSNQDYRCPLLVCKWSSSLEDHRKHITTRYQIPECTQTDRSTGSLYKYRPLSWHKCITYMDQLFIHNSLVKNELLYTTILHVGTKEKTSDFRFHGRINAPYKTGHILIIQWFITRTG
jgi:hypothetical protein